MLSDECEETEMAEQSSPQAVCPSIIFFCSKGMIEGVVVFLFIWLLIQVLLNKQQEVHLQVLLGSGLALLCFCLLMGCAICWQRRKTQSSMGNEKDFACQSNGDLELSERSLSMTIHNQYNTLEDDIFTTGEEPEPVKPVRNAKLTRCRPSLPSLYHLPKKTKRALKRRSTVSGNSSYDGDCATLVKMKHSHTEPEGLSGMKQKPPALGHFNIYYSSDETLTVTITGFSNLPKKYRKKDTFVRAYLLPGFMEPHYENTEDPEKGQQFAFFNYSPDDLKERTLRLAVYSRDRSTQREGFIGEMLFLCADVDWHCQATSEFTRHLSICKSKLKKSMSTTDVPSPSSPVTKSPGQILIVLQHQSVASRIKVMVQKGENLGKRKRIPGAPDHFVSIRLIQDNQVTDVKETRTASGSSPVWNAPFLFDVPIESIESQSLCLEFLVMQGRMYSRGRILGRVLIGAGSPETGMAHWQRMYNKSPAECSQWHVLQSEDL